MKDIETFDWVVIVLLAVLLISKLVKKPGAKSEKKPVDEKSDAVEECDARDDEKSYKAD